MMARHSAIGASGVIALFGAAGPVLDEVGFSAWLAQAVAARGHEVAGRQYQRR